MFVKQPAVPYGAEHDETVGDKARLERCRKQLDVPVGGNGGAPAAPAGGGAMNEFGIDPNMDPELALALRISMEEERARQESTAPAAEEGAKTEPPASAAQAGGATASLTVDQAAATVQAGSTPEQYATCVDTLFKAMDKIVANPTEEKFRKIKTSNKGINSRVGGLTGGRDLMSAVGFLTQNMDGDEFYYIQPTTEAWEKVTRSRESLRLLTERAKAAMPPPPPLASPYIGGAAGQNGMGGGMGGMGGGFGGGGGMPDAGMMQQAMQNPQMQQMMANNPQAQAMMQQMQSNPAMMNQMMQEMQNNPGMMQQAQQMTGQGGMGGGTGGGMGGMPPAAPAQSGAPPPNSEEDDLAAAIARSMQEQ